MITVLFSVSSLTTLIPLMLLLPPFKSVKVPQAIVLVVPPVTLPAPNLAETVLPTVFSHSYPT